MKKFLLYYFPIIFWITLIYFLPSLSVLNNFPFLPYQGDKVVHLAEYGILGYLCIRALYFSSENPDLKRLLLLTLGVTIFFAGIDELHQIYVAGRTASFYDFVFDVTGIVTALGLFWNYRKQKRNSE